MASTEVDADLKFSIIPEWLLDSEVSHKAIRIYALIARYADNQTLTAWPARSTLAARAKCTVKSVDRALNELIEAGALAKELRRDDTGQRSSVYTIKRIRGGDKITIGGGQNSHRGGDKIDIRTITNELDPINSMYSKQFEVFWATTRTRLTRLELVKRFAR
jgi:DNA replication protein DnaD